MLWCLAALALIVVKSKLQVIKPSWVILYIPAIANGFLDFG